MSDQMSLFDREWYSPRMLCLAIKVSRSTLFRLMKDGNIPQPQKWGYRTLRWPKATVQHIITHGPAPMGTYPQTPDRRRPSPAAAAAADQVEDLGAAAGGKKTGAAAGDPSPAAAPEKKRRGQSKAPKAGGRKRTAAG